MALRLERRAVHADRFRLLVFAFLLMGCRTTTLPMHDPIYPESGATVTYTLDAESNGPLDSIRLYERVSTVDASGTVSPGAEVLLEEWTIWDWSTSASVSFTKPVGYPSNTLVRYRFEVANKFRFGLRSHDVTYAIRPYPVAEQPVPVYAQGDVGSTVNVVFIPDDRIADLAAFRDQCRGMITEAMWNDPVLRFWARSFNYYINPLPGRAHDYSEFSSNPHEKPSNWGKISFAEGHVLMHEQSYQDYSLFSLFSTESNHRGTILHEAGHALFGLADEYEGGLHAQALVFPNNWKTLADAQNDAAERHKSAADARKIADEPWYKICDDDCQLNISDVDAGTYDDPCADRVSWGMGNMTTSESGL